MTKEMNLLQCVAAEEHVIVNHFQPIRQCNPLELFHALKQVALQFGYTPFDVNRPDLIIEVINRTDDSAIWFSRSCAFNRDHSVIGQIPGHIVTDLVFIYPGNRSAIILHDGRGPCIDRVVIHRSSYIYEYIAAETRCMAIETDFLQTAAA